MRNRGLSAVVFVAVVIVRLAFAAGSVHSVNHSTATAASPRTDTTTMADAGQHFRQTPDYIGTSPGREVMLGDGTTPEFGDSSEDDLDDSDAPKHAPTPIFVPGKPMMNPAPSR